MMNIQVQVTWAKEHVWHGGECLRRLQTPAHALWLVQAGAIELTLRDWPGPQQQWHLTAGDAFLAPAPCVRDVVASKPTGAHWLTLGLSATAQPMGSGDVIARMSPPFLWRPEPDQQELLAAWMRACNSEAERAPGPTEELSRFIQQSLAGAVFGLCWRARFGAHSDGLTLTSRQHLPEWVVSFLENIDREPHRSLAEWQPQLSVSAAQLRRVFHRYLGTSPQAYLTMRRLEAATQLLLRTELTAGEISRRIGFESQAHFTRRFKNQFGRTPTQYRLDARLPQI
jgi:AraC-like DNA-binding protein